MVKVKFVGPGTYIIKTGSKSYSFEEKDIGKSFELDDSLALSIMENKANFEVGASKPVEKKVEHDLNNDGVFDEKDKSIAGKVLSAGRKKPKAKKKPKKKGLFSKFKKKK